MKTLITSTAALIVALTAGSVAFGGGNGGSSGHTSHGPVSSNHKGNISSNHPSSIKYNTNKNFTSKYTTTKHTSYKNYHLTYGKKIGNHYCFPGKHHNCWDYCCFSKAYGCYTYYYLGTCCWYYFCEPDCCYYPVTYVPYRCYVWTRPVCYCSAPCPPAELAIPAPADVIGPTE